MITFNRTKRVEMWLSNYIIKPLYLIVIHDYTMTHFLPFVDVCFYGLICSITIISLFIKDYA